MATRPPNGFLQSTRRRATKLERVAPEINLVKYPVSYLFVLIRNVWRELDKSIEEGSAK